MPAQGPAHQHLHLLLLPACLLLQEYVQANAAKGAAPVVDHLVGTEVMGIRECCGGFSGILQGPAGTANGAVLPGTLHGADWRPPSRSRGCHAARAAVVRRCRCEGGAEGLSYIAVQLLMWRGW